MNEWLIVIGCAATLLSIMGAIAWMSLNEVLRMGLAEIDWTESDEYVDD